MARIMEPPYRQKLFTTGEIARIVDTTPKTVARWIDEGKLKGTKLPGMTERRVHRDAAREFFLKMGWDWAVRDLDDWDAGRRADEEERPRGKPGPKPGPKPGR